MRGRGGVEMFGLVNVAQSSARFAESLAMQPLPLSSHTHQPQIGEWRAQSPDDFRGLPNGPTINELESPHTQAAIYTRTVSLIICWSCMHALHLHASH